MKQILSNVLNGTRVCWMRDGDGDDSRVSVMAIVPESLLENSGKVAERAEMLASQIARKVGQVVSTGVYMGGDCAGSVRATGIADLRWTPETEQKLSMSGIPQLR